MARKPKCTVEEKVSAVEDYLNGIRSVSDIMVDLSIKSTRTIRDWILAYQNRGIEALCPVTANHSYSKEFKTEMVKRYLSGEGSVTYRCAKYNIPGHATLQNWILMYNADFTIAETKKIVENFSKTGLSHYLYCSSCWAHGMAETIPFNPDDLRKEPLDDYGRDKFASEMYLKEQYRKKGFPATIIMPGQISGPGWTIINPWGNTSMRVFQDIADGKEIALPNFGQEILHHVHGYDVAQVFYKAITHRNGSLGESFDAEAATHITLYGFAKHMYEFFGHEPKIKFLPWDRWCEYEGNAEECDHTYYHIARSGVFSIEKAQRLLEYQPKYTCLETIDLAVKSYIDRGLIRLAE